MTIEKLKKRYVGMEKKDFFHLAEHQLFGFYQIEIGGRNFSKEKNGKEIWGMVHRYYTSWYLVKIQDGIVQDFRIDKYFK